MALLLPGPGAEVTEPRHNLQAVCQQQQQAGPAGPTTATSPAAARGSTVNIQHSHLAAALQCHNMHPEFG